MLLTMKPAQIKPVEAKITVRVAIAQRPPAYPVFHEISPGKWAKAA